MTTDTTALQERIAGKLCDPARHVAHWPLVGIDAYCGQCYTQAAAVLPNIAAEVQAAKAEALREAATSLWADPSAERGTTKAMYNAIYATWLEQRSNDIEQEVEHGNR